MPDQDRPSYSAYATERTAARKRAAVIARRRLLLLVAVTGILALVAGLVTALWPDSALPFSFVHTAYQARVVPANRLPFNTLTTHADPGVHDAGGVRMVVYNGRLYDQPTGQASYGLSNLSTYLVTKDPFYLHRAEAQAQRLIDHHVAYGGGWFFPFRYPFALHGDSHDVLQPPWYSGMSQGIALSLFVRLYETTKKLAFQRAAHATFLSFLVPRSASGPWVCNVDRARCLWLQEYPAKTPDYTFNGHMFALFGLYDYVRLTGDANALALYQGAVTTVRQYVNSFRNPGWISRYCLTHGVLSVKYHQIHIGELLYIYSMTGNTVFARFADAFSDDYPAPVISGRLTVPPGRYWVYRFTSTGAAAARRILAVYSKTVVRASSRARIHGRSGYWFQLVSPWRGYWLAEAPGKIYLPGMVVHLNYYPARPVTIPAGTYTGYQYDKLGRWTARKTATVSKTTSAAASIRAVINGVYHVRITNGQWAGYWLPLRGLTLR